MSLRSGKLPFLGSEDEFLDHTVSFDHKQDKKLDGIGEAANAQFTHHYCNSAKDKLLPLFAKKSQAAKTGN